MILDRGRSLSAAALARAEYLPLSARYLHW
jgi:hypothetical protein